MLDWLLNNSPLLYFVQSLWRDEAFSILVSERPLASVLGKLTFEPPVYYTLLHYWMKIFGNSEFATRGLSFVGFALATIVIIVWSEKIFKKHWLSWYLPLFFFVNPMLLYYAFEVRTYGWYMFFAALSMYAYMEKRWILYVAAGILGFYTHTYFSVVLFVEALHFLITERGKLLNIKTLLRSSMVRTTLIIGLAISPWLLRIAELSAKLKSSWYFPVNSNLVKSVLGNMFLGYEGTPWYLWGATRILSSVLLLFFVIALVPQKTRNRNLFFFLMAMVPLIIVIGISFIKPLFVNRYLIPVTIAEVMLIVLALEAIHKELLAKFIAFGLFIFVFVFNFWYPAQHKKLDIRSTITEINAVKQKNDLILAESPLIFFETIYYSKDRSKVFLFNPENSPFPWYVGDAIVSSSQMVGELPLSPVHAFLVRPDGTYIEEYRTPVTTQTVNSAPARPL